MKGVSFHDLVASLVAVIILLIIFTLKILGREIDDFLVAAFSTAMGYVFRGAVIMANGMAHHPRRHRNDSAGYL